MYTKAFPLSQQHEFHKSKERENWNDMPTKRPPVWARSTSGFTLAGEPGTSHHLHMILSTGETGSQVVEGREPASPEHVKQQKERGHKKERLCLYLPVCLWHTHACTHTYQFGAKCPQFLLWTPEILLLGLRELTEGKRTPEEKGSCHLRSRIQVFGGLLETEEDAGSSKLKLWVKAS